MKKITVVVKEPLKEVEIREIDNTLEAKQKIVNGYIEYVPFGENGEFDLFLNEDGKLIGLKPNLIIKEGQYIPEVIVGTVYVSKADEEGNAISLSEEDILKAKEQLAKIAI